MNVHLYNKYKVGVFLQIHIVKVKVMFFHKKHGFCQLDTVNLEILFFYVII